MPYKISLPLAEMVFLFLVKSANKRVQLGQKNVQKWPVRVALAMFVLAELTAHPFTATTIPSLLL